MLSKESIGRILAAGGHVRIKAMNADTLVQLAATARQSKVRLEIVGSMSVETLIQVAAAGGGYVTFDISGD
jgi:hypothetical protein